MTLPIKGMEKLSVIDYPGKTCCIIFIAGCNFRCPYCHNPDLIGDSESLPDVTEEEVISFVKSRGKWLDGVCVTGGEPCIHKGLPGFLRRLKSEGFLVKLDTNGTNPEMLEGLINEGLLDYIAMDIKAPPERYGEVAGADVDISRIKRSVEIIKSSGVEHEFRTTVLPRLIGKDDVKSIAGWLRGCQGYYIQGFRPDNTLDKGFMKESPYSDSALEELAKIARKEIKSVGVRS